MSPGASNFEVTLRFLENMCTPGLVTIPSTRGHPVTDTLQTVPVTNTTIHTMPASCIKFRHVCPVLQSKYKDRHRNEYKTSHKLGGTAGSWRYRWQLFWGSSSALHHIVRRYNSDNFIFHFL